MVWAAIAMATGARALSWQSEVPSRMRDVADPHQAKGVRASDP